MTCSSTNSEQPSCGLLHQICIHIRIRTIFSLTFLPYICHAISRSIDQSLILASDQLLCPLKIHMVSSLELQKSSGSFALYMLHPSRPTRFQTFLEHQ